MFCKHCGNQIDENSKFCNFCGKSLSEQAENITAIQQTNSNRKTKLDKLAYSGVIAGLMSSLIPCIILLFCTFSTDGFEPTYGELWVNIDIGFTSIWLISIYHLIALVSIICCVVFNVIVLAKPQFLNNSSTSIYMALILAYAICIVKTREGCLIIPSLPAIAVMIFSVIAMFIYSAKKKNGE